jgi:hypothetical protein
VKADYEFFTRRMREERAAAARATNVHAAEAHSRLADQYEALIATYAEAENVAQAHAEAPPRA